MSELAEEKKHFSIQKIYIKDVSFESPDSPTAFTYKQWDPKIELSLNNGNQQIDSDTFEVVLRLTATVSQQDKATFLVEIQQAGLFKISGFSEQEHQYLIGSQCMSILFPYAREQVSELSVRGGFPSLLLSPVNFDALYQQHLQQREKVPQPEKGDSEVTH